MRKLKSFLVFLFVGFFFSATAQYTQVGNGGFTSFTYGPMSTIDSSGFFNRHGYIYPSGSISNLEHGDTIRSIEFMRAGFDTLWGNANFKIYIKNTNRADFGSAPLNWKAEARDSGMTLLYNDNPKNVIGNRPGFVKFNFNEAPYYVFDTTGAAIHLQVLVEYTQQTNQPNPIAWYNESSFYVPSFVSNNEAKYLRGGVANWNDSISISSFQIKPTIRFNHPSTAQNIEVRNVYALGRMPIKMKTADSVKAIVENIGSDTLFNHKVYLEVTGVNTYIDSLIIDTLAPSENRMVIFGNYLPQNQGAEFLTVRADTDDDISDNSTTYNRLVNYNVYTHSDPFNGNNGGIGFNGSSGDFVGKFYVAQSDRINQVKVDFSSNGRSYQIGIWEDDGAGGLPGTNIYTSDTLLTTAGTNIYNLDSTVTVTDGYYVGVRQTSNTNVAFSYQAETPVRPHTFYFAAPLGDTNWVSFAPGFNFNFNIQPRLQVANDMAISNIIIPEDGGEYEYSPSDSLRPKVVVSNYGTSDQQSVLVNLTIKNRFSQTIYTSNQVIDLLSEDSVWLNYEPFSLYNLGDFKAVATVNLNIDSVKDNNVLEHDFLLYKNHDVAADIIFEPQANDSFEIQDEGFWPQVRIFNYGVRRQVNFPVTAQLIDPNGTVVHSETQLKALDGGSSEIVVFDSIFPQVEGWHRFITYTSLFRDSFPENDTVETMVYGKKSNDIAITKVTDPSINEKIATKVNMAPFITIRNLGLKAQDSVYCFANIKDLEGNLVYRDTLLKSAGFFSSVPVLFKDFYTGTNLTKYKLSLEVFIPNDQLQENDTSSRWFEVVSGRDLMILGVDTPQDQRLYAVGTSSAPVKFRVYNNGLIDATNVSFSVQVKDQNNTIYFTDTIKSVSIATGDTIQLYSANLNYSVGGDYRLVVKNLWSAEEIRSTDDSAVINYTVKFQKDLAILDHIYPQEPYVNNIRTSLMPSVLIRNIGIDSSINEGVRVWVTDPQGSMYYNDTLYWDNLQSEETISLDLSNAIVSDEEGIHTLHSAVVLPDDRLSNDSLRTQFELRKFYDVAVDSTILPKQDFTQLIKTTHKPQFYISNKGLADLDSVRVNCLVKVGENVVFSEELIVDIDSGGNALVSFDSSLRYPDYALAKAWLYVHHPLDLSFENDTLYQEFYFSDMLNISALGRFYSQVYPNPFTESINVSSSKRITKLELYNDIGQLVLLKANSNSSSIQLNLEQFKGVYYLKIYYENEVELKKLIGL